VVVPLLAADALSRERREGTLGLLVLTGLNPSGIVAAKSFVHGLRGLSLWLATVPLAAIPFLLGGLDPKAPALSLTLNFGALCWSLAAALLASACSKSRLRALIATVAIGLVLLVGFASIFGLFLVPGIEGVGATTNYSFFNQLRCGFAMGCDLLARPGRGWHACFQLLSDDEFYSAVAYLAAFSFLVLLLVLKIAGEHLRKTGLEQAPTPWQVWQQKTFRSPVLWTDSLQRRMKQKLEANPVRWLEQRSWSSRLGTWTWLGVIAVPLAPAIAVPKASHSDGLIQFAIACLLTGALVISSTGSFRRERESGVLELLLVSPLGERAILQGRLFGLWRTFAPALGLFFALWWYLASVFEDPSGEAVLFCALSFFTLPVIGLYYSLRCSRYITALLATVAVGLLAPFLFSVLLSWTWYLLQPNAVWSMGPVHYSALTAWALQLVLAVVLWDRLLANLRKRSFPLEH
jgi:ABC-type transport system involved in multi-copper enzyme maturation permease subunit